MKKNSPVPLNIFSRLKQMAAQGATQKELVDAFRYSSDKSPRLPYGLAWEVLVGNGVITPRTRRVKADQIKPGREWPAGAVPFVPPEVEIERKKRAAGRKKAIAEGVYRVYTPKFDIEALKAAGATQKEIIKAFQETGTWPGGRRCSYEDARSLLIANHLITPRCRKNASNGRTQRDLCQPERTDQIVNHPHQASSDCYPHA